MRVKSRCLWYILEGFWPSLAKGVRSGLKNPSFCPWRDTGLRRWSFWTLFWEEQLLQSHSQGPACQPGAFLFVGVVFKLSMRKLPFWIFFHVEFVHRVCNEQWKRVFIWISSYKRKVCEGNWIKQGPRIRSKAVWMDSMRRTCQCVKPKVQPQDIAAEVHRAQQWRRMHRGWTPEPNLPGSTFDELHEGDKSCHL